MDEDVYTHRESDIDNIKYLLDEPDLEFEYREI
jgi:hypothetical protein